MSRPCNKFSCEKLIDGLYVDELYDENSFETTEDTENNLKNAIFKALHNTVSADKELRKYLLSEEEWICISDIHEILQYYKKCTELSIGQQYPILSCSIPVYNLLDKLKNEYDKRKNSEENEKDDEDDDEENDKMVKRDKIAIALNQSIEKVKQYYASTGGLIYAVTTGKFY
ncbi:hypothetical protein RclHR1_33660001 [Rhizophagus clarus]|uniref:Uncharacterized protein n=1 Tax=Rhizophagus clarus TaxID=94130 RepID=A0A2Z6RA51_9GLOM|nr:hypothetical protein RclHR1_33660001 [Rhizophagus clarus]